MVKQLTLVSIMSTVSIAATPSGLFLCRASRHLLRKVPYFSWQNYIYISFDPCSLADTNTVLLSYLAHVQPI